MRESNVNEIAVERELTEQEINCVFGGTSLLSKDAPHNSELYLLDYIIDSIWGLKY